MTKYRVLSIIMLMLFLVFGFLILIAPQVYKCNLEDTAEYTASVSDITVLDTGSEISVKIYTTAKEGGLLLSSSIANHFTPEDLQYIANATDITFRIRNSNSQEYEESGWGAVVALKVDGLELLSLDEYNQFVCESFIPARITGGVFCVVCAVLFIVFSIKSARRT